MDEAGLELVRDWLSRARQDLRASLILAAAEDAPLDVAIYHATTIQRLRCILRFCLQPRLHGPAFCCDPCLAEIRKSPHHHSSVVVSPQGFWLHEVSYSLREKEIVAASPFLRLGEP